MITLAKRVHVCNLIPANREIISVFEPVILTSQNNNLTAAPKLALYQTYFQIKNIKT